MTLSTCCVWPAWQGAPRLTSRPSVCPSRWKRGACLLKRRSAWNTFWTADHLAQYRVRDSNGLNILYDHFFPRLENNKHSTHHRHCKLRRSNSSVLVWFSKCYFCTCTRSAPEPPSRQLLSRSARSGNLSGIKSSHKNSRILTKMGWFLTNIFTCLGCSAVWSIPWSLVWSSSTFGFTQWSFYFLGRSRDLLLDLLGKVVDPIIPEALTLIVNTSLVKYSFPWSTY